MKQLFAAFAVGLLLLGTHSLALAQKQPAVPDTGVFESGIEYSNPDNQHLQLDLARPKTGDGPFPAVLCIHGGGFRAGTREGYDGLCIRLAAARLRRGDGHLPPRAEVPVPGRDPRHARPPCAGSAPTPRSTTSTPTGSASPAARPAATSRSSSASPAT